MAQTIKLRRSSVAKNVPTTAQLDLGELAINTNDGKIYFEKNDGAASIQTIVTTDSQTTGSIEITGNISGSSTSTGSFGLAQSQFVKHRVLKGWYNDNTIYDLPSGGDQGIRMAKPTPTSGNSSLPIQFTNYFVEIKRVNNNLRLGAYQGVVEIYDTLGTQNIATFGTSGLTFSMGNISGVANITATGNISGSSTSTGSFGSLVVVDAIQGNTTLKGGDLFFDSFKGPRTNSEYLDITSTRGFRFNDVGAGVKFQVDGTHNIIYLGTNSLNMTTRVYGDLRLDYGNFDITGSATSTASFGTFIGDGSQLTGLSSGISNVVEDTSPQLGGDLDLNGNDITGDGNISTSGASKSILVNSTSGTSNIIARKDGVQVQLHSAGANGQGIIYSKSSGAAQSNYTFFIKNYDTNYLNLDSSGNLEVPVGNISGSAASTGSFGQVKVATGTDFRSEGFTIDGPQGDLTFDGT